MAACFNGGGAVIRLRCRMIHFTPGDQKRVCPEVFVFVAARLFPLESCSPPLFLWVGSQRGSHHCQEIKQNKTTKEKKTKARRWGVGVVGGWMVAGSDTDKPAEERWRHRAEERSHVGSVGDEDSSACLF